VAEMVLSIGVWALSMGAAENRAAKSKSLPG
jgi:hypothetical protein